MATISTALRHFKEPTKEQLTQIFFSIPPLVDGVQGTEEGEGMEINAVLSLGEAVEDSYVSRMILDQSLTLLCTQAGKLHIMPPYLAFASLDRKSVRLTIPLSTIRRVERLNARAGIYALSLLTWHGMKLVVQLTSLRPTADLFCSLLKDALKLELQRGNMKNVKTFVKTCYSEVLVNGSSAAPENEREDGSLDDQIPNSEEITYHGGLGLKFKFPGDPKKCALRCCYLQWQT